MTVQAFYNTGGLIEFTMSPPLSDKGQLDSLAAKGFGNAIIPDGKDNSTGMINVATGEYVDFQLTGPQPPDLLTQLVAALISANSVQASSFHPASLIGINTKLSRVSMTTIEVPAQITSATVV